MRRLPFLVCALTLLAAPPSAPAAGPGTGGSRAPSFAGGATYGQPLQKLRRARRLPSRPVASVFTVAPATLEAGRPATFTFRVEGRMRTVRVRIELTRAGASAPAKRLRLGYRRTGIRHEYVWTPADGDLPAGDYTVTLRAFHDTGHGLHRTAKASGRDRLSVRVPPPPPVAVTGVFPVQGEYSFGGEEARFGAGRDGHVHQGQDITAAEGTPLVAPVAATVTWVAYQTGGAGHYVVMRGGDGRDFVFMHLLGGSVVVAKGALLVAGAQFAQVGSTGSSSGPHLHFELWPDGWYSSGDSKPVDPLPQLIAWAGTR
ncbi:MAG TPA: M23 family metallopeptidase [Solirubrobacteraceae bacterium]|nr:M23 family metallopeptidase [Solirubrobacteraceae bacterium]